MSARTGFCALAVALAGAWLLFPPRPTSAQAPPVESTERRLCRLEEKVDKLVESQAETKRADTKRLPTEGSGLALMAQASEKFRQVLESREQEHFKYYMETQGDWRPVRVTDLLHRLAKIESRRQQLHTEVSEAQQNYALVEHVYKKDGKGVALSVLAAKGVKISGLDATGAIDKLLMDLSVARKKVSADLGPAHPQVQSLNEQIELVKRVYGSSAVQHSGPVSAPDTGNTKPTDSDVVHMILAAMKAEIEGKKKLIQSLNSAFEKEMKEALDVGKQESERLRLKSRLEDARKDLDAVLRTIGEVESRRSPK